MRELKKEEAGWIVALNWLSALEETARDYHGTRPRAFCQRAYEHAVHNFLSVLEIDHGVRAQRTESIREAVAEYIRIGVRAGAFEDATQFELQEINPDRLEITVHRCIYLKSCEKLLEGGISLQDLTCARIGCFRAAVQHLADIDCGYEVTAFALEETCRGAIERR
ncbi:MAG: hypothetical protein AB1726_14525 [Planctomycetota bacterium]